MSTRALGGLVLASVSCLVTTSFDQYDANPRTALFAVSGSVDGLADGTVSLSLNGTNAIDAGNGPFAFPAVLVDGASFGVTATPPSGYACSIEGSPGVIRAANATGVAVHCSRVFDSALAALAISAGNLVPSFDSTITAYTSPVHTSAIFGASTTVTATARDPMATITIAGVAGLSGVPSAPIALNAGSNPIDVTVTAPDGKASSHYSIVIEGAPNPNDYFKGTNVGANEYFGGAVAVSGDTVVARGAGAHVFVRAGTTWTEQFTIGSNPGGCGCGCTSTADGLALAGDTLVYSGTVYTRMGTVWTPQMKLENDSASASVDADTVAFGFPYAGAMGAVHIFVRVGTMWTPQATLTNGRSGSHFGQSVSLSGNTLVIGADAESSAAIGIDGDSSDTTAPGAGAAYVFTRSGTTWSQQAYVKASNTRAAAAFGRSVVSAGDTIAVGSPGESSNASGIDNNQADTSAAQAGAAYVFHRTGTVWTQQAYVKASNTQANSAFGEAIALQNDVLAVGAPREPYCGTGVNGSQSVVCASDINGAVYVFTRTGTTWSQHAYVKASNTPSQYRPYFATSVALDGSTLAVGAPCEASGSTGINGVQNNTSAPSSGAVYVF